MPAVRKSSSAQEDLINIYLFIGRQNRSPVAAERFPVAIDVKYREYAAHPEMRTSRPDLGKDIRVFPYGTQSNPREWVVVYRPAHDWIEILRVFRGKQDYPNLF